MKKTILRFLALSIVMLLLVPQLALASGEVGTPATDFTLIKQGGGSFTLSQSRGQVIVLFIIGYG